MKRTRLVYGGKQHQGIGAQDARIDRQSLAVGSEGAEYNEVGVEILRNAQHAGAAELGRERKAVAFHFDGTAGVGIDLLASGGKRLDGELFKPFAEPVETRGRANVFKRENEVDAGLG